MLLMDGLLQFEIILFWIWCFIPYVPCTFVWDLQSIGESWWVTSSQVVWRCPAQQPSSDTVHGHHWSLYETCPLSVWGLTHVPPVCLCGTIPLEIGLIRLYIPHNFQDDFRIFLGRTVGTDMKILEISLLFKYDGFPGRCPAVHPQNGPVLLSLPVSSVQLCLSSGLATQLPHKPRARQWSNMPTDDEFTCCWVSLWVRKFGKRVRVIFCFQKMTG